MRRFSTLLLLCFLTVFMAGVAQADNNPDYTAVFNDGKRLRGKVSDWSVGNMPKLNGAPLFDQNNPIRWLKRESGETVAQPAAFVEMFGGDVMPGRVLSAGGPLTMEGYGLPHVLLEPSVVVNLPDGAQHSRLRVATRWLRRIVWERRLGDQYQPATIYYKDGRQLGFRALRFTNTGVSVLTDAERREIHFSELAEIDMPRLDWWDAYFEQLAMLTPDCKSRLVRMETVDGMELTASGDRVQPGFGDMNNPDSWRHAVMPAWSLDAIWVDHSRTLMRRYFSPHEVPASLVEPSDVKLRSALAVGWRPQMDLNVQGGPLESGGKPWGWGIGMHAYTEMHFPLPSCVRSFRSQVGLDQVVGGGGCARAIIYLDKSDAQPLWRSDHLIGSSKTVDTGDVALDSHGGKSQVVLVAHPAHADRPEGADPFDIRDVVDWLEPQFNLDLAALRAEVKSRLYRMLPTLEGWTISDADKNAMDWANVWEQNGDPFRNFHLEFKPHEAAVTLSRTLHIEPDQNFLMFYATRNTDPAKATQAQMLIRINGNQVVESEPPARWFGGAAQAPIIVPVEKFHGQDIKLEVRFVSRGDKSYVDFRSMVIVDRLPNLYEAFEDSVPAPAQLKWTDPPQAVADAPAAADKHVNKAISDERGIITSDRYSGTACLKAPSGDKQLTLANLNIPVREHPHFGEYRYMSFAWKVKGGDKLYLDVAVTPAGEDSQTHAQQSQRLKELRRVNEELSNKTQQLEKLKKNMGDKPQGKKQSRQFVVLQEDVDGLRQRLNQLEHPAVQAGDASTIVHRFYVGPPVPTPPDMRTEKLGDKAPTQWTKIDAPPSPPLDLFEKLGKSGGDITSISFGAPDGEYGLLDHIYFGRSPEDLNNAPPQAPPIISK